MLKLKFIACAIIFCWLSMSSTFAQVPPITESQARAELDKLGMSEDDFRAKLLEKGIDIDQIDLNNPTELLKLQRAAEAIEAEKVAELEEAKKQVLEVVDQEKEKAVNVLEQEKEQAVNAVEQEIANEIKEVASSTAQEVAEAVEDGATVEEALAEGIIDAKKEDLPPAMIYGQHIFRNKEIGTYRNANDIVAPGSYILGKGDKIAISLWGYSELDAVYEINKEGYIKPDQMSRINLKGISLGKAKSLLRSRFANYYRFGSDQFEVTVTYPRTITVNIVGEVMNSGSFTMPAINTAFNALAAAGGPTDIGSVRNIKIIRPGGKNRTMDVYEFLLDPSVNKDFYLEDNDIIFVEVAERLVSVQGAVRRPYKYELKKEEQLKDLIKYAGGLQPNAYQGNFQVKRFINDSEKIIDIDYRELVDTNQDFTLKGGDAIVIGVIPTLYKNFVEITGSVDLPGRYELEGGMKITDLVEKGILSEGSKTDVAYLLRTADDGTLKYNKINLENALSSPQSIENITLEPKDKLVILSKLKYTDQFEIAIQGAVRNPSTYKYDAGDDLKINDLITLAGGLKEDATNFAYVYRKELAGSQEKEYVRIDVKNALENPDSGDNLVLKPNDRVEVFSVYTYQDEFKVSISGAVRKPSEFNYDSTEKLTVEDLVILSGGLRPDATDFAYVYRTNSDNIKDREYIRIDIKNALENPTSPDNLVLEPRDQIQILSKLTYIDEFSVKVGGAVRNPGEYQYHPSLTLKDALTLSGGLKLTASSNRIDIFRMVINQNEATKSIVATVEVDKNLGIAAQEGFKLEPFDQIVVRSVPEFELQQFVTIEGEVKYPGSYALIDDNEKLTNLIKRAGGFTKESFPIGATLYRAEGGTGFVVLRLEEALKNNKNIHNFILKKGDVITIPKQKDLVAITGVTRAGELYPENIARAGKINVAYHKGKRAKWYVNEYAAGVGENGKSKLITVEYPNGEIKRTKNFLFFKIYPQVTEGSVVKVGVKPPKPPKKEGEKEREKIDWGKTLADSLAQATAILSLILLVQNVN
jgi:protein involved in polysaccharide export with SLBB domain